MRMALRSGGEVSEGEVDAAQDAATRDVDSMGVVVALALSLCEGIVNRRG